MRFDFTKFIHDMLMAWSTVLASDKKLIEKENKKLKFQIKKFLKAKQERAEESK